MDWLGQKLAEQLMQIMLVAFAMVAFSTGFVMGSFQMMILVYAGAVFLTTLITVPNWPFFNHHPLNWLDPSVAEKYPKPQSQEPVILKKKPAKKFASMMLSKGVEFLAKSNRETTTTSEIVQENHSGTKGIRCPSSSKRSSDGDAHRLAREAIEFGCNGLVMLRQSMFLMPLLN